MLLRLLLSRLSHLWHRRRWNVKSVRLGAQLELEGLLGHVVLHQL